MEKNQFLKLDGNVTKLSIYKAICVDTDCPIRAVNNCDPDNYDFSGNYNDAKINTMKAAFTCTYKNLCLDTADNTCHVNADCSMTGDGTYSCSCKTGYNGDGTSCVNNNECNGVNDCSSNAVCTDSDGSYSCECLSGYAGTGLVCDNIDECTLGYHNCNVYLTCSDSAGSYSCIVGSPIGHVYIMDPDHHPAATGIGGWSFHFDPINPYVNLENVSWSNSKNYIIDWNYE